MRRVLLVGLTSVYCAILVCVLVVGYQDSSATCLRIPGLDGDRNQFPAEEQSEPPDDNAGPFDGCDPQYKPTDPPLTRILHCATRNDHKRTSRFFNALSAVFRKNLLPLTDQEPGWGIDAGYAVPISAGSQNYVVVVLRGWGRMIPGDDSQYLYLFASDGTFLDRFSCSIDADLTRNSTAKIGNFHTSIPRKPESDGAGLIVRYHPPDGQSISGQWTHRIVYHGIMKTVHWQVDEPDGMPLAVFEQEGLCRLAIKNGKFVLLDTSSRG
jgi:hypothetical protein